MDRAWKSQDGNPFRQREKIAMRQTKSVILEAVHETAKGLHAAGVMDQVTLREFNRLCLTPGAKAQPEADTANHSAIPARWFNKTEKKT